MVNVGLPAGAAYPKSKKPMPVPAQSPVLPVAGIASVY